MSDRPDWTLPAGDGDRGSDGDGDRGSDDASEDGPGPDPDPAGATVDGPRAGHGADGAGSAADLARTEDVADPGGADSDATEASPDGPWVLEPGADETERVLDALGSGTTRRILWQLYEAPATAADIAEYADCSVQNAHYHLDKLESASLVRVVDTRYSEKGNPMDVYAPTSDPLVLAGEDGRDPLRAALDGLLSGSAVALSVLVVEGVAASALEGGPATPTGPAWVGAPAAVGPGAVATAIAAGTLVGAGVALVRWPR